MASESSLYFFLDAGFSFERANDSPLTDLFVGSMLLVSLRLLPLFWFRSETPVADGSIDRFNSLEMTVFLKLEW